jgi:hypothetical protein
MIGESIFEYKLFVKPTRQLRGVAHHQMVVELTVRNLVDTTGHERMKLNCPFRLRIVAQLGAGGREH